MLHNKGYKKPSRFQLLCSFGIRVFLSSGDDDIWCGSMLLVILVFPCYASWVINYSCVTPYSSMLCSDFTSESFHIDGNQLFCCNWKFWFIYWLMHVNWVWSVLTIREIIYFCTSNIFFLVFGLVLTCLFLYGFRPKGFWIISSSWHAPWNGSAPGAC